MDVYIISKQFYEEVYIFGVVSENALDDALNKLADADIEDAKRARKELRNWYENTHKPWAEYHKTEPQDEPHGLTIPLVEYSKTLFTVTKIELNKIITNPNWLGILEDSE